MNYLGKDENGDLLADFHNILNQWDEITADCQCGFRRNRWTNDQNFLEKQWEYNETVHQLFVNFKKTYDSVRREALCNILIKFGVHICLIIFLIIMV
jgi:hypothetical protein